MRCFGTCIFSLFKLRMQKVQVSRMNRISQANIASNAEHSIYMQNTFLSHAFSSNAFNSKKNPLGFYIVAQSKHGCIEMKANLGY